ncbi:MAG: NADH-quinone oxidoreductase subunit J [Candidatus Dadabacteria bacterium]|nr:MAG: NADH-quinone oxidoreductase subunit J [Candidatus Dadabacteria bacterium]
MSETLFYAVAALTALAAAGVVVSRNPVHSALWLVLALFLLAGIYASLGAHLVAALQIIIYAGAVMVLFLFVIMLLNLQADPHEPRRPGARTVAALLAAALAAAVGHVAWHNLTGGRGAQALSAGFGSTSALARVLFNDYLVAFELTSVLLLVAVVGAVVLARRDPKEE